MVSEVRNEADFSGNVGANTRVLVIPTTEYDCSPGGPVCCTVW